MGCRIWGLGWKGGGPITCRIFGTQRFDVVVVVWVQVGQQLQRCSVPSLGFGVWGSGSRQQLQRCSVPSLGFGVWGSGSRQQLQRCSVPSLGFGVWDWVKELDMRLKDLR